MAAPHSGGICLPPATITKFRSHESGAMKGFVDVTLSSGISLRELVLFEKHNGERWLKLPTRRWKNRQGEWQEEPIVLIEDRDRKDKFDRMVLAALDQFTGEVR